MEKPSAAAVTGRRQAQLAMLEHRPWQPLIADANAIAEDVVHYTKRELVVGRGYSRLTLLSRLGAVRVFVPTHIPEKVEARLETVTRHCGVDVDSAYANYERVHRPLLTLVELPPITEVDDPRVLAVHEADEEDGPVAQLAVLLAPALLLTKDHHLLDAGLGVAKWADALGLMQQMVAVDSAFESGAQLAVLSVGLSGAGVWEAGRFAARSPALIGLGAGLLFMLLTDWRDAALRHLAAARSKIEEVGGQALERSADAIQRRNEAEQRLQALVVEATASSPAAIIARLLAVRRDPIPTATIAERIGESKSAVRRHLAHPAFVTSNRGVSLGRSLL